MGFGYNWRLKVGYIVIGLEGLFSRERSIPDGFTAFSGDLLISQSLTTGIAGLCHL